MAGPLWAMGLTKEDIDTIAVGMKPKMRTLRYPKQLMGHSMRSSVERLWQALVNADSDWVTVNGDDLQTALGAYDVSFRCSSTGTEVIVKLRHM